MVALSRRKISSYVADQLLAGDEMVMTRLAAFLVETNRTKELELVTRDIEDALAARGTVIADVVSARGLTDESRRELERFVATKTNASSVQFREAVDTSVVGGVRLSIPGSEMDATVRRKLMRLKASKV